MLRHPLHPHIGFGWTYCTGSLMLVVFLLQWSAGLILVVAVYLPHAPVAYSGVHSQDLPYTSQMVGFHRAGASAAMALLHLHMCAAACIRGSGDAGMQGTVTSAMQRTWSGTRPTSFMRASWHVTQP